MCENHSCICYKANAPVEGCLWYVFLRMKYHKKCDFLLGNLCRTFCQTVARGGRDKPTALPSLRVGKATAKLPPEGRVCPSACLCGKASRSPCDLCKITHMAYVGRINSDLLAPRGTQTIQPASAFCPVHVPSLHSMNPHLVSERLFLLPDNTRHSSSGGW